MKNGFFSNTKKLLSKYQKQLHSEIIVFGMGYSGINILNGLTNVRKLIKLYIFYREKIKFQKIKSY